MKEHFKSTFLLLLFKVNVSSVKLLAIIKYFLSPLASLNHSRKIDRAIILMKRKMLYNIGSTCRNRSDQWPVKNPLTFTVEFDFNRGLQSDGNFLKTDIICLDDSVKYRIMAIKTNENFITFSNSVTFRKPRGMDLVTASELIPGFYRSKSHVPPPGVASHDQKPDRGIVSGIKSPPLARTRPPPRPPHGIYIDRCITQPSDSIHFS